MLRRVVRYLPTTLSRPSSSILQRAFCTSTSSNSNSANAAGHADTSEKATGTGKPKWMKFFSGQEPMQIDLDRSMKSENVELIQTYIKSNYTRFTDEQLVRVLPKISRSLLIDKVKAEIRSRILAGTFQLTLEEACDLIEYLQEINYNDRLIVFHVLTTVSEQFQHLNHLQSFQLVHISLRINKISYPIARNFLDFVAGFDQAQIIEMFAQFDHQQATSYMFTLAMLKQVLSEEILNPTIMEAIIKAYLNKLNEFINLNEVAANIHFDRIFNPTVLRLFNPEQKLEFKQLLVKAIELRFDTETNLGKFGYIKGDKSITIQKALGLLREVVHTNERSLVEKCLVLIGNSVLNRDNNEFKFDFRMFTFFTKYNYAYKFYIDESFISMKSLLRAVLSSTRRSLSEEQDYNSFHLLFLKSKAYSELNYGSIISNSEDVYTRKVDFSDSMKNQWNQFQADLQDCLQDYLQMQISSNFFEKVLSRIPDRSEINQTDEQENDDVQIETFDGEESGSNGLTNGEKKNDDLRALKHGETYASEWMQHDRDAVEGSLDKGQSAQFKDDDDYMKKVGYKLIEYQRRLSAAKYVKYVSYQQRTTFAQTAHLRYFICTVETISNSLATCEPSEEFLAVLRMWAKQDKLIDVLECFGMVPSVLESLLFIEAYGKIKKNQAWFSPAVTEWMLKNKFIVESILSEEVQHNQRNPNQYLSLLEKQIASLVAVPRNGELPLDIAYDPHQIVSQMMNASYFVSQERYEAQLVKVAEMSEGNVRLQRKRDFVSEQFVASKENLIRKVMHSQVFSSFVNESQLKKFTGDVLFHLSSATQKNVVFYPFFADFLLPSKKIVVQVREKNRLIDGVENQLTGFNQMNEQFLKMIGYRIVYIELADFEIDFKTFQLNVLQKIFKSSSSSQ